MLLETILIKVPEWSYVSKKTFNKRKSQTKSLQTYPISGVSLNGQKMQLVNIKSIKKLWHPGFLMIYFIGFFFFVFVHLYCNTFKHSLFRKINWFTLQWKIGSHIEKEVPQRCVFVKLGENSPSFLKWGK